MHIICLPSRKIPVRLLLHLFIFLHNSSSQVIPEHFFSSLFFPKSDMDETWTKSMAADSRRICCDEQNDRPRASDMCIYMVAS